MGDGRKGRGDGGGSGRSGDETAAEADPSELVAGVGEDRPDWEVGGGGLHPRPGCVGAGMIDDDGFRFPLF